MDSDRHIMGSFSQLKSFPIKWNQTDNVFSGANKVEILGPTWLWNLGLVDTTFFFSFDLENLIFGYFHNHIRNQRLKIRGYSEFQINSN